MNEEDYHCYAEFSVESKNSCRTSLPTSKDRDFNSETKNVIDLSDPIWSWRFIHNFIRENSEKLLDKYDTEDDFFKYLSELLMNKLSTKKLLKNLHQNTIKALPKVIIAIFLLFFQKIHPINGDDLEKKSGMKGQYRKLRTIAGRLNLELPFIMGDVAERLLNERKEQIFNGRFFPSTENLSKLHEDLKPSRKLVKTISRWISKNSNYKNLTELKERVFEKKIPTQKKGETRFVLLDRDPITNRVILRNICDTIIEENLNINSYSAITRAIGVPVNDLMRQDYRYYIKYSDFLKLQKLYGRAITHQIFVKQFKTDKWIFIWQDSKGNHLSNKQALKVAGDYLLKEILRYNTKFYTIDYVIDVLGRNDFISAISQRGLKYNEILNAIGLDPNVTPQKWEMLNWRPSGNPRTYEEAFNNAIKYIRKLLLDEKFDFQSSFLPSHAYMKKYHEDFLGALSRYNLNYYDILTRTGFPSDKRRKKWKIIDTDAQGFVYERQSQEDAIFRFFKDKILPVYEEKNLIKNKIGPSYDEAIEALKNMDFRGFISASNARGITYGELLRSVGLSPRVTLNQKVGTAFHWIAQYNFMMHTRVDNKCISYYESKIHNDDGRRPDNSIKVNRNFRNLSRDAKNISENIEWIHIDYYLFHSSKRSIYKFDRGYQNEDSLLILNPLNIKSNVLTSQENVKILSPFNFCIFFGFSEYRRKYFINFARLALQATNKDNKEALNKLIQEAEICKNKLKSGPKINFKN